MLQLAPVVCPEAVAEPASPANVTRLNFRVEALYLVGFLGTNIA